MYSVFDICQFGRWVYPFGNSRVKGCLGPHRDFSHPATSFFGFLCLGIHRLHLFVRNRLKCLSNCFALSKALLNRLKQVILNLMLVSNSQSIMVKYEWLINCQIAITCPVRWPGDFHRTILLNCSLKIKFLVFRNKKPLILADFLILNQIKHYYPLNFSLNLVRHSILLIIMWIRGV